MSVHSTQYTSHTLSTLSLPILKDTPCYNLKGLNENKVIITSLPEFHPVLQLKVLFSIGVKKVKCKTSVNKSAAWREQSFFFNSWESKITFELKELLISPPYL